MLLILFFSQLFQILDIDIDNLIDNHSCIDLMMKKYFVSEQ